MSRGLGGGGLPGAAGGGIGGGSAAGGGAPGGAGGPNFEECATSTFQAARGLKAANLVWVIDTSGSMDEEGDLVQRNLNQFVSQLAAAGLEDYRMVVISEPSYVTVPEPLASDTTHFRYINEEVGSNEPLEDLLGRFSDYQSFLLPGAMTHFVVVTDDESDLAASQFISQMDQRLPGEFRVHAIASPPGVMQSGTGGGGFLGGLFEDDDDENACVGPHGEAAAPGVEHYAAAMQTMGLTFSICEEDWTGLFGQLATAVGSSATIPCTLELPTPQAGSLDHSLINVVFTPQGASSGRTIARVAGMASCTGEGWYYDDPMAPQRVLLCPASCMAATGDGQLQIALGCATVVH